MDQNSAAGFDTALNESIAFREMLEEILIFNVIYFDSLVREAIEEAFLDR